MRNPSEVLNSFETDCLIRLFFYHADSDMRKTIMCQLPLVYAQLFPDVIPHEITSKVVDAINAERGINDV